MVANFSRKTLELDISEIEWTFIYSESPLVMTTVDRVDNDDKVNNDGEGVEDDIGGDGGVVCLG